MKFGKVEDVSGIDFNLPDTPAETIRVLKKARRSRKSLRVSVGSAQWGDKNLVGKIYPKKTPAKKYLYHYSRHFHTIELNTTHYRIPSAEQVKQWLDMSKEGFLFCPKFPQIISHRYDFGLNSRATENFAESLSYFGEHLGIPFMQLPTYLDSGARGKLVQYISQWPKHRPMALELRHDSWFADPEVLNEILALLEEKKLGTVITDTAGRRDVIHMRLTSPTAVVRFVGNSLHDSDYRRIDEWVNKLEYWVDLGLHQLFFFVHQPTEDKCVDLAVYLIKQLNEVLALDLVPPRPLDVGVQQRLF